MRVCVYQYRFADGWDKLAIVFGLLMGVAQAALSQFIAVIVGSAVNEYVDIIHANQWVMPHTSIPRLLLM